MRFASPRWARAAAEAKKTQTFFWRLSEPAPQNSWVQNPNKSWRYIIIYLQRGTQRDLLGSLEKMRCPVAQITQGSSMKRATNGFGHLAPHAKKMSPGSEAGKKNEKAGFVSFLRKRGAFLGPFRAPFGGPPRRPKRPLGRHLGVQRCLSGAFGRPKRGPKTDPKRRANQWWG